MADQCLSHIAGLGTKYPHTLSVDCCVWSLKKQSWWADSLPITAICHSTKVCGYYTAVSPRSLELELQTAPLHMGQPNLWAAAVLHGPVPKSQGPFKHCWLMMALRNSSAFAHLLSATLEWYIASTFTFFQVKKGWNRTGGRTKLSPGTNSMLWSPMAAKTCVWNLWNSFWSSDHNCVVDLLNSQQREQNWIEGL